MSTAPIAVNTGSNTAVEIIELQPAGRKRMTAEEFSRGYPLTDGDRFGPEEV
jgi:methionyl-tRNA formyltransferase